MHEFICFRNPILKSSIVQPPNPVVRLKKALPEKQTIRDALRHPRIIGLGISHHVPNAEAHPSAQRQKKEKTRPEHRLFRGRGVLGDGLGALRHGVLGQLTRQDQANTGWELKSGHDCRHAHDAFVMRGKNTHEVWISRDEMVDFLL